MCAMHVPAMCRLPPARDVYALHMHYIQQRKIEKSCSSSCIFSIVMKTIYIR